MILLAIIVSLLLPAALYLIMQGIKAWVEGEDGAIFLAYGLGILLILAIAAYDKTAELVPLLTKGLLQ